MRRFLLVLCLFLWPAAANAQWREASTRHFVIYSQQSEGDLRRMAERLERFDKALRVTLRRQDPDRSPATRLTIYVFRREEGLQAFLGMGGVGGVYMARDSGSIAFVHEGRDLRRGTEGTRLDPRQVLYHEYTHHFLSNNFSFGAPLWFSEGYAEFWGSTEVENDGTVHFGRAGTHRSAELTYLSRIPAGRLVTLRHPIPDGETFAAIYGRGWLLAHYLSFEPSRAGQLDAYLRALGEGKSTEEAARAFGDLDQLSRDVDSYLGRNRYSYATLRPDQVTPGPIQIRRLRPGEDAIMSVRMQSKRGVNEDQARNLVPQARRIGQQYPNDPLVQTILAEVEYDADNFAEAEAAADRAIAADPNMVDAHLFKARAIWGRLAAAENKNPEEWRAVQRAIGAANRLDPDDPEPLIAFYDSFAAMGQTPTDNAVEGLLYAQTLAPEDRSLRIRVGRLLLSRGNAARAAATLGPVAGDTHSGALGAKVTEVLDLLRSGDTAGALAKLDAALAERNRPQQGRRR